MKKFVLAFGIPVLAVASLIGSGYATWYFNSGIATGEKGITVEPTEKKVVGAVFEHSEDASLASLASLVLDQPDDTTDGMPHDRQNVHFDGTFKEFLKAYEGDDNPSDDKFVDGTFYKVTTTITISPKVAEYVNFTFNDQTSSADVLTLTKEISKLEVKSDTPKYEVFDISDVTVAYTDKKPSTAAEYETMKSAVKDQSITISFEAEIVTTK